VRKLSDLGDKPDPETRKRVIIEACQEVGPGLFFSLLIIVVSFLPVFALTGESYRLFSPLAFTVLTARLYEDLRHDIWRYSGRNAHPGSDVDAVTRQNAP